MVEGALKQDGLGHSSLGSWRRNAMLCVRTNASTRLEYIKNVALRRQHAGYGRLHKRALIAVSMWISFSAKTESWVPLNVTVSAVFNDHRWRMAVELSIPTIFPLPPFCLGKLGVPGAFPARW